MTVIWKYSLLPLIELGCFGYKLQKASTQEFPGVRKSISDVSSHKQTAPHVRTLAPHAAILLALSSSNGCLPFQADSPHGHKLAAAVPGILSIRDNVQQKNRGHSFFYLSLRMEKKHSVSLKNRPSGGGYLRNVRVLLGRTKK